VRAALRLEEADGVIAIPRGALFDKDGQRVVYRWQDGSFTAVAVTVSRNSVSRVVVDSGIEPGDRIALRDPTLEAAAADAPAGRPAPAERP
jgi:hypothetical protein